MHKILIVEDNNNIRTLLHENFVKEGYKVFTSNSILEAKNQLNLDPDLIILDWMLPDGQGLDFLSVVKNKDFRIPVIFLTARVELVDKILGLEMGANDYMTKPFEMRELLARVRVQLRNQLVEGNNLTSKNTDLLSNGNISLDKLKFKAYYNSEPIDLVKKEFDLLTLFLENPDKVFSRDEILNKVWGYDVFPTTRTVDTHVMQIRQKTFNEIIETVRSVGYRFNSKQ